MRRKKTGTCPRDLLGCALGRAVHWLRYCSVHCSVLMEACQHRLLAAAAAMLLSHRMRRRDGTRALLVRARTIIAEACR